MWRLLQYSVLSAVLVTGLSYGLMDYGGKFLVQPGIVGEVMLNVILLLIPTGDEYLKLPAQSYLLLNVLIYSAAIFAVLVLLSLARTSRQR